MSPGYQNTHLVSFVPDNVREGWKDKIPMGRQGQPAELRSLYLFLASDASTYTTGADICSDGGYTAV